jgi:hypothetical protein
VESNRSAGSLFITFAGRQVQIALRAFTAGGAHLPSCRNGASSPKSSHVLAARALKAVVISVPFSFSLVPPYHLDSVRCYTSATHTEHICFTWKNQSKPAHAAFTAPVCFVVVALRFNPHSLWLWYRCLGLVCSLFTLDFTNNSDGESESDSDHDKYDINKCSAVFSNFVPPPSRNRSTTRDSFLSILDIPSCYLDLDEALLTLTLTQIVELPEPAS